MFSGFFYFFLFALVGALEVKEESGIFISEKSSTTIERAGFRLLFGNETSEFLENAYRKKIFKIVRRDSDPSYFQENLIKDEDFKILIDEIMTTKGLLATKFVKLKKEQKDLGETEELIEARTAEEVLAIGASKVITLNALLAEKEDNDGDDKNHPRIRESTKDVQDAPSLRRIRNLAKDLREATGAPRVGMNLYLSQGDSNVLPPHTDMYDVLVAQIYGWKNWTTCVSKTPLHFDEAGRAELYESQRGLANGCTNYEESNLKGDDGMHCEDFMMGPGDVLYMPKGVIHVAHTSMYDAAHVTISIPMNKFNLGSIFETLISKYVSEEDSKYACVIVESTQSMIRDTQASARGIVWRSLITDIGEISLHRKIARRDAESVRQKFLDLVGLLRIEKRLAETMLDNPSSKCDVYAPPLFMHRLGISVRKVM